MVLAMNFQMHILIKPLMKTMKKMKSTFLARVVHVGEPHWTLELHGSMNGTGVFLLVCVMGLFVDPLFFYTHSISESCMCVYVDGWLAISVTVLRCMTDVFHVLNLWLHHKINRSAPVRQL
ncbi:hypothetical protein HanRHA438_Chr11g0490991 [Helianthus annuus]|nr:hypothetical protein HanRHA438_Chr11g0490991 [Helianthus annuus]